MIMNDMICDKEMIALKHCKKILFRSISDHVVDHVITLEHQNRRIVLVLLGTKVTSKWDDMGECKSSIGVPHSGTT